MKPKSAFHIGRLLQNRRLDLNLRQADLAHAAGVSRQWIVALEKGSMGLDLDRTLRTIDALALTIDLQPRPPLPDWVLDITAAETGYDPRTRPRRRLRKSRRPMDV